MQTNNTHSSDEVELKGGVNFKPEENPIPNNDANQIQSISGAVEKVCFLSIPCEFASIKVRLYVSSQNDVTTT